MRYTATCALLILGSAVRALPARAQGGDSSNGGLPRPDTAVTAAAAPSSASSAPTPSRDSAPDPLAAGIAAFEARDPGGAVALFRDALARDSLGYEPNWRIALALITLGQETPDSRSSPARDSLYAEAERRARTAVRADTNRADGWFILANAIGRTALTRPPDQRLKLAAAVRNAAVHALLKDPGHDGAYHVLGRWHAEIMRLPGIHRFFARRVLGARVFDEASWDEAQLNLERAVALDSTRIVHRLDLAEIYADRKRYAEARAQLDTIAAMPEREYLDPRHKKEAAALLSRIANKAES
jgi:tetratricopeptide (TPR) repeat protein